MRGVLLRQPPSTRQSYKFLQYFTAAEPATRSTLQDRGRRLEPIYKLHNPLSA